MLYQKINTVSRRMPTHDRRSQLESQLVHQKETFSSAKWVLSFMTCTARVWQNNKQIYTTDFISIRPCFASHTQKSQILTASILLPLKHPRLVLSFLGIKIIPANVRQSRQIINLKGLGPIWLGLWVCYNGIKIQKMNYTPLLFASPTYLLQTARGNLIPSFKRIIS